VLEGESDETLSKQLQLFHERALPDLSDNIKCGNSLIGPDFYDNEQMSLLDEKARNRINTFDWETEFPEIMKCGGFDTVIGNPPYVRQEVLGELKTYFKEQYAVYHGMADLYVYFIQRGVSLLSKNGLFGFIVSNKWLRTNYGEPLRRWLKTQHVDEITDFGDLPVFLRATTYPCILLIKKDTQGNEFRVAQMKNLSFTDLGVYVSNNSYTVDQASLDDKGWSLADDRTRFLLEKLESRGVPLGEYVGKRLYRGILTGFNEAFVIDAKTRARLIAEDPSSKELIKPFLLGRDIKRYQIPIISSFLMFTRRGIQIDKYPAIKRYLSAYKSQLMPKPPNWKGAKWEGRKPGNYKWYEIQDAVDYYQAFEKPKIIIPAIVQSAAYTFDNSGFYSNDKTSIIETSDLYLLGLLNSKVLDFVMHLVSSTKSGGYFEYKPMYLEQLPIRNLNLGLKLEKECHDQMVEFVERMLSLNINLSKSKTPNEVSAIQRQIETTDRKIDQLVYELYGLTAEEIQIVENAKTH
jgi:hypothetical protein